MRSINDVECLLRKQQFEQRFKSITTRWKRHVIAFFQNLYTKIRSFKHWIVMTHFIQNCHLPGDFDGPQILDSCEHKPRFFSARHANTSRNDALVKRQGEEDRVFRARRNQFSLYSTTFCHCSGYFLTCLSQNTCRFVRVVIMKSSYWDALVSTVTSSHCCCCYFLPPPSRCLWISSFWTMFETDVWTAMVTAFGPKLFLNNNLVVFETATRK